MDMAASRPRGWPLRPDRIRSQPRVTVLSVNYNTRLLIAQLIYSIVSRCEPAELAHVVVVDNASRDGSRELLTALAQGGLCHLISNSEQRYHGPALNQAMDWLVDQQTQRDDQLLTDYVWVLDSDCVILRDDTLRAATETLRSSGAALCGQRSSNAWHAEETIGLYSLLFDPAQVWRDPIRRFDDSGEPSLAMQLDCAGAGLRMVDFPFSSGGYVVHRGRSTLAEVYARGETDNTHYDWARGHHAPHFNAEPGAAEWYERFSAEFRQACQGRSDDTAIVEACLRARKARRG
jgi:glycosyltransferase involved in cell wall biosynthesis